MTNVYHHAWQQLVYGFTVLGALCFFQGGLMYMVLQMRKLLTSRWLCQECERKQRQY